jgi:hypothetical protein
VNRAIQNDQIKGARSGELFSRPSGLCGLIRAHKEHAIFLGELNPIERFKTPRTVHDGHTPTSAQAMVNHRPQQGGPTDPVLTDPGGDHAQRKTSTQKLIERHDTRREA